MIFLNFRIPPKQRDIGWEHATSVGGDRKLKCNYCGKIVHGDITRMKQHLANVSGQVEVSTLLRKHLSEGTKERASIKAKKEHLMKSLTDEAFHEIGVVESEDEIDEVGELEEIERRQLKKVMRESREMT